MNREIKFRGKSLVYGKWTYGFYNESIKPVKYGNIITSSSILTHHENIFVSPETVGQFTGLLDRNGKEIYEGDVMICDYDDDTSSNQIVGFSDGCFYTRYVGGDINHALNANEIRLLKLVVIGNIHDTPELLNRND